MKRRLELLLSVGLVVSSAFYGPFTLWATNAWDLSSPIRLLLIGVVVSAIGMAFNLLVARVTRHVIPSAIGVSLVLLVLGHWYRFEQPAIVITGATLVGVATAWLGQGIQRGLAVLLIAVFGVAPLLQVPLAHIRKSESYPIVELTPRVPLKATGLVEDILVVVVDSYPSLTLARRWFGHDPSALKSHLTRLGYDVEETAWSQFTFTGLTVPSMMELKPLVEPGPTGPWGNHLDLYRIVRGDSLVATGLRSAGYEYYHVESGWDGGACGDVDVCLDAPFVDESMWSLAEPSVLRGWVRTQYGYPSVSGTLNAVRNLKALGRIFDDGRRDYVYAHLLLPHVPLVVDSECETRPALDGSVIDVEANLDLLREQLTCADGLISEIATLAGDDTAVLIMADHGTARGGQVRQPASEWTDADIAERFSIFLTYRLPDGCLGPTAPTNLEVMRAAVSCAVTIELPPNHGRFLIGASDPEWVDVERMNRIEGH